MTRHEHDCGSHLIVLVHHLNLAQIFQNLLLPWPNVHVHNFAMVDLFHYVKQAHFLEEYNNIIMRFDQVTNFMSINLM